MKKLLTLDVGTTAVKAAVFDETLRQLAVVIREYQLSTPGPDLVELDPDTYWNGAIDAVRTAMRDSASLPEEVAAITCTTQGETLIPVDAEGRALHPAVVWLDSRAQAEAKTIAALVSPDEFYGRTGVPEVNGYCPVAKLLWFKNQRPEIYEKAEKFLLLEDYLVYRLSGRFVTNPAVMCTTGYYDIAADWLWTEILDKAGLDSGKIPEVLPCASRVGTLLPEAAEALGLTGSVIVATGAMDQVTGAIGAGNIREGTVSETTGTAMVIAATTAHPALEKCSPVSVYSHAIPGRYLYVDVRQTAGIVQKWFRDEFCRDLPKETAFAQMSEMAGAVPPLSRGVMLYPHLTGIQAPVLDEKARGVFFGLGLNTDRACLIRAIYEGIGYALRESFEMMQLTPAQLVSMGGGSKSGVWNQIKADICSVPITIPEVSEAASLGAAILGGVAAGIFPDIETPAAQLSFRARYTPIPENTALYAAGYEKYRKMYDLFAPLFG